MEDLIEGAMRRPQLNAKRHPWPFASHFAAGTARGSLRKSNTYVFDFRRPNPWGAQQGDANCFCITLLV
jgi:hypothetical protein